MDNEKLSANEKWTRRLRKVMPFGSSTCSKAPRYLPEEPGVIVRGKGCRVWDADGREFIDYRNGLGPVTLGYGFPEVDDAIRQQLDSGIIYGQPHPLECEVAEMLCEVIPAAEQARFLKTGGEAVAAVFRLARQYTGRSHIIQTGYNGWLNSLASGGKVLPSREAVDSPPGVPEQLSRLHHSCPWNDIGAMEEIFDVCGGDVAAVAIAANYPRMPEGETFYPAVRELTRRKGAVLIFDEIVTGFRVAIGGVQEHFNVTPDLTVFAKGIANGMPLSVYAGRSEIMEGLHEAVVSSTYGGETLSLAAARATVKVYTERNVTGHIWKVGKQLWDGFAEIAGRRSVPVSSSGFPPCAALSFSGDDPAGLKERFFRAAYRNGVSLYTVNYPNFSHKEKDIAETLEKMDKALGEI